MTTKKKRNKPWTATEIKTLRTCARQKMAVNRIRSRHLRSRSESSIRQKLFALKLGVRKKRTTQAHGAYRHDAGSGCRVRGAVSIVAAAALAAACLFLSPRPGEAATHHPQAHPRHHHVAQNIQRDIASADYTQVIPTNFGLGPTRNWLWHGGAGPRPRAWCGWAMRQLVGADPGPSYNLARNWAHWGRSGPAGIGAVVVWAHHVGKIIGQEKGQWVIESGNDGHALRSRARSIKGAIAIRWG